MIFRVINIGTGYLNRPNWLLVGYSFYHRVASQPTMFMTGPRSRHQRRQGCHSKFSFSRPTMHACAFPPTFPLRQSAKFYTRVQIRFETGSGFDPPPPPPAAPPTQLRGECPPPPTGPKGPKGGGGGTRLILVNGGVPLKWVTFFPKNP